MEPARIVKCQKQKKPWKAQRQVHFCAPLTMKFLTKGLEQNISGSRSLPWGLATNTCGTQCTQAQTARPPLVFGRAYVNTNTKHLKHLKWNIQDVNVVSPFNFITKYCITYLEITVIFMHQHVVFTAVRLAFIVEVTVKCYNTQVQCWKSTLSKGLSN